MFVVVHVDDFLCSGEEKDLKWLQQSLEEEFELKANIIVPGCSASYLGRTISWHDDGISIEGANKYIDHMVEDWSMQSSSPVSTPGTSDEKREEGGDEELGPQEATLYRRSAAMCNYMSQD